jgi:hypothetical protein
MQRIRDAYLVPAKRGARIDFRGQPATIVGATQDSLHLIVRFDDSLRTYRIHPTWEVTYPHDQKARG